MAQHLEQLGDLHQGLCEWGIVKAQRVRIRIQSGLTVLTQAEKMLDSVTGTVQLAEHQACQLHLTHRAKQ